MSKQLNAGRSTVAGETPWKSPSGDLRPSPSLYDVKELQALPHQPRRSRQNETSTTGQSSPVLRAVAFNQDRHFRRPYSNRPPMLTAEAVNNHWVCESHIPVVYITKKTGAQRYPGLQGIPCGTRAAGFIALEVRGFEPLTYGLQSHRSSQLSYTPG
jgi:hypothetical protein